MQTGKTAILAFVREPSREARLKSLWGPHGNRRSLLLFQRFNQRLRSLTNSTGLPVIWLDESLQQGQTFGERITSGIELGFELGFDRLIVLGNDCPNLRAKHVQRASEALDQHDWVIGPDQHGGAYLIGLTSAVFDAAWFTNLPWQTNTLFSALQQGITCTAGLCLLSAERDVNTAKDLRALLPFLPLDHFLRQLLQGAFDPLKEVAFLAKVQASLLFNAAVGLRGPPQQV